MMTGLESQVSVFLFPRDMVAQLYSQTLSLFFVASYWPQGYVVGILTGLNTGMTLLSRAPCRMYSPSGREGWFSSGRWMGWNIGYC
jgi:hypothetical protein